MKLKIFGYALFVVICIVFSLYVRFPSRSAAAYIEQHLFHADSRLSIKIENLKPCFPPGLKADTLFFSHDKELLAKLEKFRSAVDVTTVFNAFQKIRFRARVFDGTLSGIVRASRKSPMEIGIDARVETLGLKAVDLDKLIADCRFSGLVNGKISAGLQQGHLAKLAGEFTGTTIALDFAEPLFAIETYSFSSGNVKFGIKGPGIIKIDDLTLKGRQADIQASGDIRMGDILQKSRLNLDARVVLYPVFFMNAGDSVPVAMPRGDADRTTLHLRIGGTFENPTIGLDRGKK